MCLRDMCRIRQGGAHGLLQHTRCHALCCAFLPRPPLWLLWLLWLMAHGSWGSYGSYGSWLLYMARGSYIWLVAPIYGSWLLYMAHGSCGSYEFPPFCAGPEHVADPR